jgi:5-aminolevulinate synthase
MQYNEFFNKAISDKKKKFCYRKFVNISKIEGKFPLVINNQNNQKIAVWCSNDYLALGQNQNSISQATKALKKFGIGSGGTRNISGTTSLIVELEKRVAELHQKDAGLVFTSGYIANDTTIKTLGQIIPNLIAISDEKNHASIISGIKGGNLQKKIFRHNDIDHLEEILQNIPKESSKIIIFQSIYSMAGDLAHIKQIVKLAKKYQALTYIDEVHSVGLYGKNGAGVADQLQVADQIDIIQGTFAKAFGSMGGYICASEKIIDTIRLYASGFIFTTSMAPAIIAGIIANMDAINPEILTNYHQKIKSIKSKLEKNQIPIIKNDSHIIAIKVGNTKLAEKISTELLEKFNIYIQHINFPTVPKGEEMLRITVTPLHDNKMIDNLVEAISYFKTHITSNA